MLFFNISAGLKQSKTSNKVKKMQVDFHRKELKSMWFVKQQREDNVVDKMHKNLQYVKAAVINIYIKTTHFTLQ